MSFFANFRAASLFFWSLLIFISMDDSGFAFLVDIVIVRTSKIMFLATAVLESMQMFSLIKSFLVYFKPSTSTTVTAGFPHALLEGYTGLFK